MSSFTSLHLNSEYSLLQSTIKLDNLFSFAQKHQLTTLALTDHNVMFGVSEFIHKCQINNIKPIIGVDLDVENFRLILLAQNNSGYKTLLQLSSQKMHNKEILLNQIDTNNLIVIDHPTYGYYHKYNKVLKLKNFYVGTTKKIDLDNAVYVNDTRILESDAENHVLEVLNKIGNHPSQNFDLKPYPLNPNSNLPEVKKVQEIINQCNLEFVNFKPNIPKFKNPENINSFEYLKKLVVKSAKDKLNDSKKINPNLQVYQDRIAYELEIIKNLDFADYFLIIYDIVNFAKNQKILVGPGRGSVAGSLIAFLLNITEVDPLKFDLLFERFLNPSRVSMPDIDLDFQDNRREEVVNYIFNKYGLNHVGLISTFQRLGPKMSLRDIGKNLQIHLSEIEAITKTIPNLINAPFINSLQGIYDNVVQFRAMIDKKSEYKKLFNQAKLIEGLPRQSGTHAAGIVICDQPLVQVAPTIEGPNHLNQIQFPMDFLEQQGLLKIDILGLKNLTILQNIQEEVQNNHQHKINLQQIPLNDKPTNELLTTGNTNGIFQLESYGMKKTVSQVGIDSVDDVTAVISLYRPGPMDNIKLYIEGKKHHKITKLDSSIDSILKNTYGIIVYQEQIMQLVQKFSGMSFGEADIFRRAIGKKDKNLLQSLELDFINGAKIKGHDDKLIKKVYDYIAKFANFGFNKSHAVSYAILSYRLAYLKAHFPLEFYTALLNSSLNSSDTIKIYINEIKSQNIPLLGPEINWSKGHVFNYEGKIILPFTMIKGIGQTASQKILEARNLINKKPNQFADLFEAIIYLKLMGLGEASIQLLIKANVFRNFYNINTCLSSLPILLRYSTMIIVKKHTKDINDDVKTIDTSLVDKPNLIIEKQNLKQEVESETQTLGLPINIFLTMPFETKIKLSNLPFNKNIELVVLIEKSFSFKTKQKQTMGTLICSDSSSIKEITVFPDLWIKIKNKTLNHQLFNVKIIKVIKDNLTLINLVSLDLEPKKINDYERELKNE